MEKIVAWFRQPSTLTAVGIVIASAVYWFTKSGELAAVALAAVLGTVSDSTAALLAKIENVENIVANIAVPPSITTVVSKAVTMPIGTAGGNGSNHITDNGITADKLIGKVTPTPSGVATTVGIDIGVKSAATLMVVVGLLFGLSACSSAVPAVQNASAAVNVGLAKATADLQGAVDLYGVAKGIAQVAAIADPAIAPKLATAIAVADPIANNAVTMLAAASTDAVTLEAFAVQIVQQANALTLQSANNVKVVPAS